jgi:hypothetical protein
MVREQSKEKLHLCEHQQLEAAGSYFQSSETKMLYDKHEEVTLFYEVRMCIIMCMVAHHSSLSRASWIQYTPSHRLFKTHLPNTS